MQHGHGIPPFASLMSPSSSAVSRAASFASRSSHQHVSRNFPSCFLRKPRYGSLNATVATCRRMIMAPWRRRLGRALGIVVERALTCLKTHWRVNTLTAMRNLHVFSTGQNIQFSWLFVLFKILCQWRSSHFNYSKIFIETTVVRTC